MAKNEDNTVSSKNQLTREQSIFGKDGTGKKILFLGNSITRHGVNEGIGWLHDWGMAASSYEKDYVHQTMSMVYEKMPDASFLVAQVSEWERAFWDADLVDDRYAAAENYGADIIVMRAIENVQKADFESRDFVAGYEMLLNKMNPDGHAKIVATSSFWPYPVRDELIKKIAEKNGWRFVDVAIGGDDKYTAKGLFEHAGVAAHPGDEGMAEIARRIFANIEDWL